MKDLKCLNIRELEEFFNSFDLVLSDVDGVLWLFLENIPGTDLAVKSLKQIGKRVIFVSNNTTKSLEAYHKQLTTAGFDIEQDEIVTPVLAMISYLKQQNVRKEVFVIGMSPIKRELELAGFKLAEEPPSGVDEDVPAFIRAALVKGDSIGVVISDADINLNFLKMQRAASLLKNPNVLFLTGATDHKMPVGLNHVFIGPGYFHKILETASGRQAYPLAKPSANLNEYIVEKFKITNKSRVLFIGDSPSEDMAFATNCGYKKLLVLSGLAKKECLEKWPYPEEFKPDYYVDTLTSIHDLISKTFPNKL